MKKLNFLKQTVVAMLAVVLVLGYSSCSSDDDNDEGTNPAKPTKVLLPTKISSDGDVHTFTYNDKNQIVEITSTEEKELPETVTFNYDAAGKVTSLVSPEYTETIEYNDAEGTVTVTTKKNDSESQGYYETFRINKNGYPASFTGENELEGDVYEYDKYNNLVKNVDFYKSVSSTGEGEEPNTISRWYIEEYTYSTVYSPFLNVSLPGWFKYYMMPSALADEIIGSHTPTTNKSTEEIQINDGERIVKDSDLHTVTVLKQQDNYPTQLKVSTMEDGKLDEWTINIEYKEAK